MVKKSMTQHISNIPIRTEDTGLKNPAQIGQQLLKPTVRSCVTFETLKSLTVLDALEPKWLRV